MGMTKLDAVNEMLASIGEKRFPSTGSFGSWPTLTYATSIAGTAEFTLDRVSRTVQTRGFKFNTVRSKAYVVAAPGPITFAAAVVRAAPAGPNQFRNWTVRSGAGYDNEADTATFAAATYYWDVVTEHEFSTCPEDIKQLIVKEAKQEFQREQEGSPEKDAYIGEGRNKAEVFVDRAAIGMDVTAPAAQPLITQPPQPKGR